MRIFSWLIGLPLAVVVVLFALSNRDAMQVGMWPFDDRVALPIYVAVLAPLLLGFLLGFLTAGLRGLRHRRAARLHAKRAAQLEKELETARATLSATPPSGAATPPAGDLTLPP